MNDDANRKVLDRQASRDFAAAISQSLDNLAKIVNYGTHLILRCWVTSERKMEDIVALLSLLQQVVAMTDAVEVLLREGVVQPAMLQCRSIFEMSATMQWLLKSDSDQRARAYLVSNLRRERLWGLRAIPGSNEERAFKAFWEELKAQTITPERAAQLQEQVDSVSTILQSDGFRELNDLFDRHYSQRGYEMPWFKPVGANSFRQIADDLGQLKEYDILYAFGSGVMHGSTFRGLVEFDAGRLVISPLRSPNEMSFVLRSVMALIIRTYRVVLEHYRPGEIQAFSRKYVEDWQRPLSAIPQIEVKPVVADLMP